MITMYVIILMISAVGFMFKFHLELIHIALLNSTSSIANPNCKMII